MLALLLSAVVIGSFWLGKLQERARREDEELEALRRMWKR